MKADITMLLENVGAVLEIEDFGHLFRLYCKQQQFTLPTIIARQIVEEFVDVGDDLGYDIPLLPKSEEPYGYSPMSLHDRLEGQT